MIINKHRKTVRAFSVLTCDVTLIIVEKDMFGLDFELVSRHRCGYHLVTTHLYHITGKAYNGSDLENCDWNLVI